LDALKLLTKLRQKFGVNTDSELAAKTGIALNTLAGWKRSSESITEQQVANLLAKAVDKGQEYALNSAIKPIVEFYPISHAESRQGANYEIIPTNELENPYDRQLRTHLEQSCGLYIYYDSVGKVIYVGKAERQNLWKEMNSAFNRKRASQKIVAVEHSGKGDFSPAHESKRRLKEVNVYLYDIAVYFSAYQVSPFLISNLEAFLIRALPNDLNNDRLETFKYD
jgi:transcriptional regulator with XRE-family HTH domain